MDRSWFVSRCTLFVPVSFPVQLAAAEKLRPALDVFFAVMPLPDLAANVFGFFRKLPCLIIAVCLFSAWTQHHQSLVSAAMLQSMDGALPLATSPLRVWLFHSLTPTTAEFTIDSSFSSVMLFLWIPSRHAISSTPSTATRDTICPPTMPGSGTYDLFDTALVGSSPTQRHFRTYNFPASVTPGQYVVCAREPNAPPVHSTNIYAAVVNASSVTSLVPAVSGRSTPTALPMSDTSDWTSTEPFAAAGGLNETILSYISNDYGGFPVYAVRTVALTSGGAGGQSNVACSKRSAVRTFAATSKSVTFTALPTLSSGLSLSLCFAGTPLVNAKVQTLEASSASSSIRSLLYADADTIIVPSGGRRVASLGRLGNDNVTGSNEAAFRETNRVSLCSSYGSFQSVVGVTNSRSADTFVHNFTVQFDNAVTNGSSVRLCVWISNLTVPFPLPVTFMAWKLSGWRMQSTPPEIPGQLKTDALDIFLPIELTDGTPNSLIFYGGPVSAMPSIAIGLAATMTECDQGGTNLVSNGRVTVAAASSLSVNTAGGDVSSLMVFQLPNLWLPDVSRFGTPGKAHAICVYDSSTAAVASFALAVPIRIIAAGFAARVNASKTAIVMEDSKTLYVLGRQTDNSGGPATQIFLSELSGNAVPVAFDVTVGVWEPTRFRCNVDDTAFLGIIPAGALSFTLSLANLYRFNDTNGGRMCFRTGTGGIALRNNFLILPPYAGIGSAILGSTVAAFVPPPSTLPPDDPFLWFDFSTAFSGAQQPRHQSALDRLRVAPCSPQTVVNAPFRINVNASTLSVQLITIPVSLEVVSTAATLDNTYRMQLCWFFLSTTDTEAVASVFKDGSPLATLVVLPRPLPVQSRVVDSFAAAAAQQLTLEFTAAPSPLVAGTAGFSIIATEGSCESLPAVSVGTVNRLSAQSSLASASVAAATAGGGTRHLCIAAVPYVDGSTSNSQQSQNTLTQVRNVTNALQASFAASKRVLLHRVRIATVTLFELSVNGVRSTETTELPLSKADGALTVTISPPVPNGLQLLLALSATGCTALETAAGSRSIADGLVGLTMKGGSSTTTVAMGLAGILAPGSSVSDLLDLCAWVGQGTDIPVTVAPAPSTTRNDTNGTTTTAAPAPPPAPTMPNLRFTAVMRTAVVAFHTLDAVPLPTIALSTISTVIALLSGTTRRFSLAGANLDISGAWRLRLVKTTTGCDAPPAAILDSTDAVSISRSKVTFDDLVLAGTNFNSVCISSVGAAYNLSISAQIQGRYVGLTNIGQMTTDGVTLYDSDTDTGLVFFWTPSSNATGPSSSQNEVIVNLDPSVSAGLARRLWLSSSTCDSSANASTLWPLSAAASAGSNTTGGGTARYSLPIGVPPDIYTLCVESASTNNDATASLHGLRAQQQASGTSSSTVVSGSLGVTVTIAGIAASATGAIVGGIVGSPLSVSIANVPAAFSLYVFVDDENCFATRTVGGTTTSGLTTEAIAVLPCSGKYEAALGIPSSITTRPLKLCAQLISQSKASSGSGRTLTVDLNTTVVVTQPDSFTELRALSNLTFQDAIEQQPQLALFDSISKGVLVRAPTDLLVSATWYMGYPFVPARTTGEKYDLTVLEGDNTIDFDNRPIGFLSASYGVDYYLNVTVEKTQRSIGVIAPFQSRVVRRGDCYSPALLALRYTRECAACPDELTCNGSLVATTKMSVWRAHPDALAFYSCSAPYSGDTCRIGTVTGECLPGHTGPRCARCLPGYGKAINSCVSCDDPSSSVVIVVLAGVAVFVVVSFLVHTTIDAKRSDQLPIYVKILLNHLTFASSIGDQHVQVPSFLRTMFQVQRQFSRPSPQFSAFDCVTGWNWHQKFIAVQIVPAVIFVVVGIAVFICRRRKSDHEDSLHDGPPLPGLKGSQGKNDATSQLDIASSAPAALVRPSTADVARAVERQSNARYLFIIMVVILFILYPLLVEWTANALRCEDIDFSVLAPNGTRIRDVRSFFYHDRTVACNSPEHRNIIIAAAVLGILWGFGIPAASVLTYVVMRKKVGRNVASRLFTFLIAGYNERVWWWEVVLMFRKLSLIYIIAFISTPKLQLLLSFWVLAINLVAHTYVKPYDYRKCDIMEQVSLFVLCGSLNMILLFDFVSFEDDASLALKAGAYIIAVLILLINIGIIIWFAWVIFSELIRTCRKWLREHRQAVREKACADCCSRAILSFAMADIVVDVEDDVLDALKKRREMVTEKPIDAATILDITTADVLAVQEPKGELGASSMLSVKGPSASGFGENLATQRPTASMAFAPALFHSAGGVASAPLIEEESSGSDWSDDDDHAIRTEEAKREKLRREHMQKQQSMRSFHRFASGRFNADDAPAITTGPLGHSYSDMALKKNAGDFAAVPALGRNRRYGGKPVAAAPSGEFSLPPGTLDIESGISSEDDAFEHVAGEGDKVAPSLVDQIDQRSAGFDITTGILGDAVTDDLAASMEAPQSAGSRPQRSQAQGAAMHPLNAGGVGAGDVGVDGLGVVNPTAVIMHNEALKVKRRNGMIVASLRAAVAGLREHNDVLAKRVAELEEGKANSDAEADKLRRQIAVLTTYTSKAEKQLSDYAVEVETLRQQVTEQQRLLDEQQALQNASSSRFDATQRPVNVATAKILELQTTAKQSAIDRDVQLRSILVEADVRHKHAQQIESEIHAEQQRLVAEKLEQKRNIMRTRPQSSGQVVTGPTQPQESALGDGGQRTPRSARRSVGLLVPPLPNYVMPSSSNTSLSGGLASPIQLPPRLGFSGSAAAQAIVVIRRKARGGHHKLGRNTGWIRSTDDALDNEDEDGGGAFGGAVLARHPSARRNSSASQGTPRRMPSWAGGGASAGDMVGGNRINTGGSVRFRPTN